MNKKEYEALKLAVIKEFGPAEYDMGIPANDSAKRLAELKQGYIKAKDEVKKTKKLAEQINKLSPNDITGCYYPEELLRPEWLVSFSEVQRAIVKQWMKGIDQTAKEIAEAANTTVPAVNATKSLEAFKMLRAYLNTAFKDQLPFPALFKLKQLLHSENESVAKDVAKMILLDAGLFKPDSIEQVIKTDKTVLYKDLQAKLKLEGDAILGIGEDSKKPSDGVGDVDTSA